MEQVIDRKILERLNRIQIDIEIIKERLDDDFDYEGELSDYAIEELEKARGEPEESCISLDDLKKEIEDRLSN